MDEVEQFRSGHVVIGVDTHKHIHVAAVMDSIGGTLATLTIATDTAGFRQLLHWAAGFGKIIAFGIEGTGSYGAGLTSFVRRHGHKVVEVSRPDRRLRSSTASPTHSMLRRCQSRPRGVATPSRDADGPWR